MLDRIRGRGKDDPALEELRRRTAARLAAIVGLTGEAELDTELEPHDAEAADAMADEADAADALGQGPSLLAIAPPPGDEDENGDDLLLAEADSDLPSPPGDIGAALPGTHGETAGVDAERIVALAPEIAETASDRGPDDLPLPALAAVPVLLPATASVAPPDSPVAPVPAGDASVPGSRAPRRRASGTTAGAGATPTATPPRPGPNAAIPMRRPATAAPARGRRRKPSTDLPAACPTCGRALEEIPITSRRCLGCRQRIVPKRVDGRTVLLAEAVVPLFEAERRRLVDGGRLMRACGQWLRLAALVGAPPDVLEARARAVAARPTREAVAAARKLYATTVEAACRTARRSKDWGTVADLRFRQARAYHRAGGAPNPPDPAVLAIHREAVDATLRGIAETSREAALVGGTCCEACSARTGRTARVSGERKEPSLPHADCPVGLCGCRWKAPARKPIAAKPGKKLAKQPAAATRKAKTSAG